MNTRKKKTLKTSHATKYINLIILNLSMVEVDLGPTRPFQVTLYNFNLKI